MGKMIVSDIDGTLFKRGEEVISDSINDIISEIKSQDIIFAVASGRHYNDLYKIMRENDGIYYICCDGGCIIHNNEVVYIREISKESLKKTENLFYHTPFEIKKYFNENDRIIKISAFGGGYFETPFGTYEVYRDKDWREWIKNGSGKGQAVEYLQRYKKISVKDTIAFGDNFNDMGMFRKAGIRYCMKSAPSQVKMLCGNLIDNIEKSLREAGGI